MSSKTSPKLKTPSPQQVNKRHHYQGSVWPPIKCTPLCFESGDSECSNAGKHHELIMTLAKCSNAGELEKTNFKKALDKFNKTKWLRSGCVPERNEKLRFPLVHWACILGKYKALEYLVSEKGFELMVKVGKNQQGPLHSMVQHLTSGLSPKSSKEYIGTTFGNVINVFLKHVPEVLCEKDASLGDTILHFLAKRCTSDPYSRMYLKILLVNVKESDKVTAEKAEEILSAVNKRGDTFLHLLVSDENSVNSLDYFFKNFGSATEKISKAKNNFGKTPRQLAVEKKSFEMLRALGAPDVVIDSLKKAVTGGRPSTPKRVSFAGENGVQTSASKRSPVGKPSSERNGILKGKDDHGSNTSSNLKDSLPVQETSTESAPSGYQQQMKNVTSDQLQAKVLKVICSDLPSETTDQANVSTLTTKITVEPSPQLYSGINDGKTTEERSNVAIQDCANELPEPMDVDMNQAPKESPVHNVFLSLSDTLSALKESDSTKNSKKRPAPRTSQSRRPRQKRGRMAEESSDSESDVEDPDDIKLDDDSDDDMETGEEDDEQEDDDNDDDADYAPKEGRDSNTRDEIVLETVAPKHTPFCRPGCTAQHHKLLLNLLKCSNYNYGSVHIDSFIKQVNDYVTHIGKFAGLRANADLPDPVVTFKYPLVHWVCVLGKYRVLEKLAEMKEFNLGVQSERTGETGVHRMLLSLDRGMVLKKNSVKTILEVFSKTLRVLTDNLPNVITVCNKEGDTPFHCLAKVILDCTGELERMNTYEGYFEQLIKELTHLKTTGKLTPEIVGDLLLKTNKREETFLHILACRHGVGHRVIKSVLKNIEPEIMDVLKGKKDADGKTPSDLAEDLCSYEMAAILRPRDEEALLVDGNDDTPELPQTLDQSTPSVAPGLDSPPATLFQPMECSTSPLVPDSAASRKQLFSVKKEPRHDGPGESPSVASPVEVNSSPCSLNELEDLPLRIVKHSPGRACLTPSSADAVIDVKPSPVNDSIATESVSQASTTNLSKATSSPSVTARHGSHGNSPSVPVATANHNSSGSVATAPVHLNRVINMSSTVAKTYTAATSADNHSKSTSVITAQASVNRVTSMSRSIANQSDTFHAASSLANENRSADVATTQASLNRVTNLSSRIANHSEDSSAALQSESSSVSTNRNRDTSSPKVADRNNVDSEGEPSGIISKSGNLLNTLHAKFQEEFAKAESGLKEKEDALACIRQRIEEGQAKKQKLLQELEQTLNDIMADTREEGWIQSEITAKKRDCERFKTELAKYETSLNKIRK